jgi:hypothetical protein
MRKKISKRYYAKLKQAFDNDRIMFDGITRAYVSGINSKSIMTKEQARYLAKQIGGHWKDLQTLCPIIYKVEDNWMKDLDEDNLASYSEEELSK